MKNDKETISYLRAKLVDPLNKLLDAKPKSDTNLDCSIVSDVEKKIAQLREEGKGKEVSEVLMPLYRELLFNPKERMVETEHLEDNRDSVLYAKSRVTMLLYHTLYSEDYLCHLFDGMTIIKAVELCIVASGKFKYNKRIFLYSLVKAVQDGYKTDWDKLYEIVKPELVSIPTNCNRSKVEYCCMVMSVIMIMRDDSLKDDERNILLTQLYNNRKWYEVTAHLYSVLLGIVLNPNLDNNLQIMRLFAGSRYRYAHLLCACIKYKPDICKAPKNQPYKQKRYDEAYKRLLEEAKSYQERELDKLFSVLFPKATISEYASEDNSLKAEERERNYAALQRMYIQLYEEKERKEKDMIDFVLKQNESIKRESEKGYIAIDDLKCGFEELCSIKDAEKFFSMLDLMLHKNRYWLKRRDEFIKSLKERQKTKDEEFSRYMMCIADSVERGQIVIQQMNFGNGEQNFIDELKSKENS